MEKSSFKALRVYFEKKLFFVLYQVFSGQFIDHPLDLKIFIIKQHQGKIFLYPTKIYKYTNPFLESGYSKLIK
jgi:hypothetical protein